MQEENEIVKNDSAVNEIVMNDWKLETQQSVLLVLNATASAYIILFAPPLLI